MIKWKHIAIPLTIFATAAPAGADAAEQTLASNRPSPPRLISGSISNLDYPAEAIRAGEQGTVRMQISVDADGVARACEVIGSSGSPSLDERSCALAQERFRFAPGRDAAGVATPSIYRQSVRWVMPDFGPDDERALFAPTLLALTAVVRGGQIDACTMLANGQEQTLPVDACQGLFSSYPMWESLKSGLVSATHVYAFTPDGFPPPSYPSKWGDLQQRFENRILVGPDGRTIGCAGENEADFSPCPTELEDSRLFEPSSEAERRGRNTSTLFVVTRR